MVTNPLSSRLLQATQATQNYKNQLDALEAKKTQIAQKQAVINSIANPADPLRIKLQNELAALNPSYINSQYNTIKTLYDKTLLEQQGIGNSFENYESNAQNYYNQQNPNIQQGYAQQLWLITQVNQPGNIQAPNANRVTLPEWPGTRYANTVESLLGDANDAEKVGNFQLATDLRNRANVLKSQWTKSNEIQTTFFDLWKTLDNFYSQYANQMSTTEADLLGKIKWMKDIIEWQFWPEGTQTKRLEEHYGNLRGAVWNRLTTTQAWALWEATKTGTWSVGAGMIMNEADRKSQEEVANIWLEEAKAYDDLYKTYDQYLNNFITQYGNVKDKFTVDTLQKLLSYKTILSTQAQDALRNAIEQKYAVSSTSASWLDALIKQLLGNQWLTVPTTTWTQYTTTGNISPVTP